MRMGAVTSGSVLDWSPSPKQTRARKYSNTAPCPAEQSFPGALDGGGVHKAEGREACFRFSLLTRKQRSQHRASHGVVTRMESRSFHRGRGEDQRASENLARLHRPPLRALPANYHIRPAPQVGKWP